MNFVSAVALASNGAGICEARQHGNLPKRYHGYEIVPNRQWSQWCVSVYTTRADLPLFSR